jgi:Mg2+-importing ATPase
LPNSPDSIDRLGTDPLTQVLSALATRTDGLSSIEAGRRLEQYGPNRVEERPRRRLVVNFLLRFRNPLVLVLLGAAAVSAFVHEHVSFVIISVIVLLSITLDFIQEHRAENAADALRQRVALRVRVMRDGEPREMPSTSIVPGDVILLSAGDLVPADCRLIEARDLYVNEAVLTGESYPAEKKALAEIGDGDTQAATPLDAIYMGSSVVSGTARAVVIQTGRRTRFGAIAASLRRAAPETAFSMGIRDFGLMIVRLTSLLTLFVLLVNLLFERPFLESFLFALALAVGLTPELLPMVVSVTLAYGAVRMSRERVIVKRLSAIHDLGSMDVLCSDKTGTLTEARIKLIREVDLTGAESHHVLELAYLNAAFETGIKSPLDEAILAAEPIDLDGWSKIDEVPFDFERRRVSVLIEKGGRRRLVVKGAPESVLDLAARYQRAVDEAPLPIDESTRIRAREICDRFGEEGFRVLGIAWRDVEPSRDHADLKDEADLIFAGFAAFLDPPKKSAGRCLKELGRLGVSIKIVTGDNEHVTQHVCRELGIAIGRVVTGPEIETLTDEALGALADASNLFCRVTPAQKARIIRALRRRGHVVGYLGDGINDAPSLHDADVGLSVEGAVDVAQAAASMILLRKDLGVLAGGVREGRRTFANIMKYVMMGTSSNFGNMFSMAAAVLFLPFLPMLPVQILLNNLLYDISEATIPKDRVDREIVLHPRHWDIRFVRNFMLVFGPVSSLFDFMMFGLLLYIFHAGAPLFHTGWFVESLATQVFVIFVIRTRGNPLKSRPHPLLVAGSLSAVFIAFLIPYTPMAGWFGFVPMPPALIGAIAALIAVYLLVVEQVKRVFFRHMPV